MEPTNLREWSIAVRKRDAQCVRCGSGDRLHAHHIKRKWEFPELRLDIDNGETLCFDCHAKEHESDFPGLVKYASSSVAPKDLPSPRHKKPKSKSAQRIEELEKAVSVLTKQNLALIAKVTELSAQLS